MNLQQKLEAWKKLTTIKYKIEINKERKRDLIRNFEIHFIKYRDAYKELYNPIEPPCKE